MTEHEKCLTNGTYERARESGTEQNYNMIDDRLNNGVEKFNREEEKKEKQEKPEARFFLKGRLAAKQKEAAQGKNKDMKDQEKSKNTHREI